MDVDLKFDYGEAMKRQNLTQEQVDALRESAKMCSMVPKSLTNKQVNISKARRRLVSLIFTKLSFSSVYF